jgi:uncharacterized protein (TIGR03086 family)
METNADLIAPAASTPASKPDPTDPRPRLAVAAAQTTATLHGVTDDQLTRATPCAAFDVATLVDHLTLVAQRITSLGHGTPDYSVDHGGTAGWPMADITAYWETEIARAAAAWTDPESLTRMLTLPFATLPGAAVLTMYVSELTVHTWDLAEATGQRPEWDPEVVETSIEFMHQALPADIRGSVDDPAVPFAPVIATADDAPGIDRLVAWCGRNPDWR